MNSCAAVAKSLLIMPKIDPIRPTESVFSWIIVNREGVLVGALVAAAIVAVMLVARMIGHRIVAKETETPTFGWKAIVGRVLFEPLVGHARNTLAWQRTPDRSAERPQRQT